MAAVANVQPQQPAVGAVDARPVVASPSSSLSIKVWRAVSLVFEILAKASSLVIFAAVLTTNLSPWHLLTSLALSYVAKRAANAREKMHDFDHPEELEKLRANAPHMSYSELRSAFKWSDLKHHNLIPIEGFNGLKHKVLLFLATPANFSYMQSIFGSREVDCLLEHGIIDVEIAAAIRGGNQGRIQLLLEAYQHMPAGQVA